MQIFVFWNWISLKFVPRGPIDKTWALVQIMAWRRTSGNKPLPEPMLIQSTDAYRSMRHKGEMIWCDLLWTLQWRYNGHDIVSNHQPHACLFNRLFRRRSKKTSKLRVTGLCAGNSPLTGEFPAQMASNAENVSIWWRPHEHAYRLTMTSCHLAEDVWTYMHDVMRVAVCESNDIMTLKSQVISKSQITTEVNKTGDPLSVRFMIYLKYTDSPFCDNDMIWNIQVWNTHQ